MTGKGECRMTLSELLALLTLLVAAAALMVEVAKAGFDIAFFVHNMKRATAGNG